MMDKLQENMIDFAREMIALRKAHFKRVMEAFELIVELIFDVRTLGDAIAVPKIIAHLAEERLAKLFIDHTSFGQTVAIEVIHRWQVRHMAMLKCDVYCPHHACDAEKCPRDGYHVEDQDGDD